MRRNLMGTALLLCSAIVANAATVGESPLANGGSVDGWSGITVLDGYGGLPAGDAVSTVNYYVADDRDPAAYNVQPIIAQDAGGVVTVWAAGPVSNPAATGENSVLWNSAAIPADGNTYHPGFYQWQTGVNNTAGGVVSFAGAGGSGMAQTDVDSTTYTPSVGDDLSAPGHASGADGRAYQINFETAAAAARFCDTSTADVCFDFDGFEGAEIYGNSELRATGGVDGGYLKVTDAANGERGKIILPDVGGGGQFVFGGRTGGANAAHHIDNLEASIVGDRVEISAWLRVGGGTDRPADGFSFNFVRPGDPLLAADTDGWAGVGTEPGNLPEEGSTTGISIGFDEWQSGPAPENNDQYTGANGDELRDVIGMSLRVDGNMLGQADLPTLNGALDDITSLQTGPNDDGINNLGWAQLTISAPIEGATLGNVQVSWKGSDVAFVPEPATNVMVLMALASLGLLRRRKK